MRKYTHIVIMVLISVGAIATAFYASVKYTGIELDFSKVVNALQKLPYLYEFIQEFFIVDNKFSLVLFHLVRILIELILGVIIISLLKSFICQGVAIIHKETKKVVFSGAAAYIMILTLLILFFSSIIGFPIAVIILIFTYILGLIGKVSLAVFAGNFVGNTFKRNLHIYLCYLIGGLLIEIISFTPYIGQLVLLCTVPAISIGIFIVMFLNKFIYKIYYPIVLEHGIIEKKYIKEDIRKIIMKNIDE